MCIRDSILYAYTALMLFWGVLVLVGLYKRIHYGEKSLQYTEENRRIIIGHTNVWFVKATGAYLKTDKKTDSKMFGISLGLYH